jgi:hypothetical protein
MMMDRRRWILFAKVGLAWVIVAMIVVALVLLDKPHFGWMVGRYFSPIIASGVVAGSIMMLAGAWMLVPERKQWRGIVLLAWAFIGATSPIFGFLFLLPWSLLVVSLPLVIWILFTLR